jgi:zinc transport system substrate-binding protein
MAEISEVDIYFFNGHLSFEQAWIEKLESNYPNLELVKLNDDIDLLHGHDCNDPDHHHHDHGTDPHTWLSPANGKIIARHIYNTLSEKYPQSAPFFKKNFEKLIHEIDDLDAQIRDELTGIPTQKFMIFHPSLSYFARDYGLEQLSIEFEGKEPSPSNLRASIDIAREQGIKTILIQKEFDMENARIIAREINGSIVEIDPLSRNWADDLLEIASKIRGSSGEKTHE